MRREKTMSVRDGVVDMKSVFRALWIAVIVQTILQSHLKTQTLNQSPVNDKCHQNTKIQEVTNPHQLTPAMSVLEQLPSASSFGILFAEAGKKKKKEKSEVVVISVNNPKGGGGGMYPIYIPTCGGGHHGGYGRRRRR